GPQPSSREAKPLVRLVVCGEPGRGKRTLIESLRNGRLPPPAKASHASELVSARFETESRRVLVTIPGEDEQWMHTLVTAAGSADCALILVDPRNDLSGETLRHTRLLRLLEVPNIALAINKMDLIDYAQERLSEIEGEYRTLARQVGVGRVTCIPTSALVGDNVCGRSAAIAGYDGPTVIDYLESVAVGAPGAKPLPFRMYVDETGSGRGDRRACSGTVASGSIGAGEVVVVSPSGAHRRVVEVVKRDGKGDAPLARAAAGQSVSLLLAAGEGAIRGGD